jgi:hypothetical protein
MTDTVMVYTLRQILQCWGSDGIEMSETYSAYDEDNSSYKICVGKVKRKRLLGIFGSSVDHNKKRIKICELFWIVLGFT